MLGDQARAPFTPSGNLFSVSGGFVIGKALTRTM
jgi:hypothetical protein